MKKYVVTIQETVSYEYEVESHNPNDAGDLAMKRHLANQPCDNSATLERDITSTELVTDGQ